MDLFYGHLQGIREETREVASDSAAELETRLTDARRLLALGRDFVRDVERDVQQLETSISALRGLSGQNAVIALRGRRLGDVAVELLRESGKPQPIHYTEWFRILEDAGRVIEAKDPMATFLTSITRDDRIERVGQRTGLYQLKGAPA